MTLTAPTRTRVATASAASIADVSRLQLPLGWPVFAIFWLYPVWWAMGFEAPIWPIMAVPMAAWLLRHRDHVRAPKGFGVWLVFLLWVLVSAVSLHDLNRVAAYTYRDVLYITSAILLLYTFNLPRDKVPTRRLMLMLLALWTASVVGGILGILFPGVGFRSPLERLLPHSIVAIPFVEALVHPRLGSIDSLYGVPRPSVLFSYTNDWGAAMGVLMPLALYAMRYLRTKRYRLLVSALLVVSLIPVIVSINRGLWVSMAVAAIYVAVRAGFRGNVRVIAAGLAGTAVLGALVVFTPLSNVILDRLATSNTSTRATLYHAATNSVIASPLLGYGAPLSSTTLENSNNVSIGTHGQLWTLLVSQGFPGAGLFLLFLIAMLVKTWHVSMWGLWPHSVIVVGLVQSLFYDPLPAPLAIVMLSIVLCWRNVTEASPPTPGRDSKSGLSWYAATGLRPAGPVHQNARRRDGSAPAREA